MSGAGGGGAGGSGLLAPLLRLPPGQAGTPWPCPADAAVRGGVVVVRAGKEAPSAWGCPLRSGLVASVLKEDD